VPHPSNIASEILTRNRGYRYQQQTCAAAQAAASATFTATIIPHHFL
jgi:hypothetical protein